MRRDVVLRDIKLRVMCDVKSCHVMSDYVLLESPTRVKFFFPYFPKISLILVRELSTTILSSQTKCRFQLEFDSSLHTISVVYHFNAYHILPMLLHSTSSNTPFFVSIKFPRLFEVLEFKLLDSP